ncbi:MAG TPA: SpoIIE family protein phosphatase [Acidimicrobiia bacterium]
MTLRRRLLLVFAAYVLVGLTGTGFVVRGVMLSDQAADREDAILGDLELGGIGAADRQALQATQDRRSELRTERNLVIVGMIVAMSALTVGAALLVRRSVTTPLDRIARAVRDVRAGARHTSIPAVGPPEIARLGHDVERLRRRLNSEVLEAVKAREAVEQSASVLLSLRSELEPEVDRLPAEWTVAGEVEPAEGVVAGDCYDVVRISASQLGLVVVDIAGHGAVPGVLALRCRELLRAALRNGLDPGASVRWAHDQLDDLGSETFLSAFVAVADLATGGLRYANAGHPPPILCTTDVVVELPPTGPIVGPFDSEWQTASTRLANGDTLAVYTDGLVEVRRDEREEFGVDRLVDLVSSAGAEEADVIVKRALDEIEGFATSRLRDDATVVLLCRGPREHRAAVKHAR